MGLITRPPYRVKDVLAQCRRLQRLERVMENQGVSELLRLAVLEELGDDTAVVLCRLLFKSGTGEPLRRPMLGEPGFLGGGENKERWPLEPIHFFRGIPFYVVSMYSLGGLAESGSMYLSHCLRNGFWNDEPFPEVGDEDLQEIARDLIRSGPWDEPLPREGKQLILSQVE